MEHKRELSGAGKAVYTVLKSGLDRKDESLSCKQKAVISKAMSSCVGKAKKLHFMEPLDSTGKKAFKASVVRELAKCIPALTPRRISADTTCVYGDDGHTFNFDFKGKTAEALIGLKLAKSV